jgi:hypothetical protein
MDAEEVAERIREDARRRRERLQPLPTDLQAAADIAFLESAHDVYHADLTSPRQVLGALTVLAKRAGRRLLAAVLGRQVEFNAAVARVARHTAAELAALEARQDELRTLLASQEEQLRALRAALDAARRERP